MKIKLCFLLTIALGTLSNLLQAQNWAYFPENTMRCYYIDKHPIDHYWDVPETRPVLSGIRFNKFDTLDEMRLDSFGVLRPLKRGTTLGRSWYISGNSNFGNRIQKVGNHINMFFVHDSFRTLTVDSFLFLDPTVNKEWQFCDSDSFSIIAKVGATYQQETYFGLDSVKQILLIKTSKLTDSISTYNLILSKNHGIIHTPNFLQLKRHSATPNEITLRPYKEMYRKEFYRIDLGTKTEGIHINTSYNTEYFYENVKTRKEYFGPGTDRFFRLSNVRFIIDRDYNRIDSSWSIPKTKYEVFEPNLLANRIPGKTFLTKEEKNLSYDLQYFYCDNLLAIENLKTEINYKSFDTIYEFVRIDYSYVKQVFVQHVGEFEHVFEDDFSGIDFTKKLTYFSTRNCSFGVVDPELANVTKEPNLTINFYPNPAKNTLQFSEELFIETVTAISPDGQLTQLPFSKNSIDVTRLTPGIYIIELQLDNELIRKKVIIQ
jgi:hypothetical protein